MPMRLRQILPHLLELLARSRRKSRPPQARPRLELEGLEDRTVPAVVSVVNGVLTYSAANNVANNLSVSYDSAQHRYTLTDSSEIIFLGGGVQGGNGNFTSSVSFSDSNISALELQMGNS